MTPRDRRREMNGDAVRRREWRGGFDADVNVGIETTTTTTTTARQLHAHVAPPARPHAAPRGRQSMRARACA
ncbi:hypothetical protein BGI52_19145 [Burkholderia pseudomallei]|nr:hypothetical protein BGI49_19040 [Burkholderia pseudomallei]APZ14765.1 hypothetical protein BGI52_19145 [Burkholderia pseudomallei]